MSYKATLEDIYKSIVAICRAWSYGDDDCQRPATFAAVEFSSDLNANTQKRRRKEYEDGLWWNRKFENGGKDFDKIGNPYPLVYLVFENGNINNAFEGYDLLLGCLMNYYPNKLGDAQCDVCDKRSLTQVYKDCNSVIRSLWRELYQFEAWQNKATGEVIQGNKTYLNANLNPLDYNRDQLFKYIPDITTGLTFSRVVGPNDTLGTEVPFQVRNVKAACDTRVYNWDSTLPEQVGQTKCETC